LLPETSATASLYGRDYRSCEAADIERALEYLRDYKERRGTS
jgi:uncharacterized protein (DUF433 family)